MDSHVIAINHRVSNEVSSKMNDDVVTFYCSEHWNDVIIVWYMVLEYVSYNISKIIIRKCVW